MNYKIIEGDFGGGIESLEKKVNDYIKIGWTPLGGICVVLDAANLDIVYYQSMIFKAGLL